MSHIWCESAKSPAHRQFVCWQEVTFVARFFTGRRMLRRLVRFEQVRIHSRQQGVQRGCLAEDGPNSKGGSCG